jgi:hypothetical protein
MGGNRPTSAQQIEQALWSALFDIATQDLDATLRMQEAFKDMGEVLQGEFEQKELKWFTSSAVVEPSTARIEEEPADTRHHVPRDTTIDIEMHSEGQPSVTPQSAGEGRAVFAGNADVAGEQRMAAPGPAYSDMNRVKDTEMGDGNENTPGDNDIERAQEGLNDIHLTDSIDVEMSNSEVVGNRVHLMPTEDVEMGDGTVEDSAGVNEMELSADKETEPRQRSRPDPRARGKGKEPPQSTRKASTQDRPARPSSARTGRGDTADNPIILDLLPTSSRFLDGKLIEVIDLTKAMVRTFLLQLPTTHQGIH